MKTPYIAAIALLAVLMGCMREPEKEENSGKEVLVPIELKISEGKVHVSRASNLDALMSTIYNATLLVFDNSDNLVVNKNIQYDEGERVYLKAGSTYKVFVVANLDDSNCPNGDALTYLAGVSHPDDLKGMYILNSPQSIQELGKMVMCSDWLSTLTIPHPIGTSTIATITLKRLHTKISLNIYNRTDPSGVIQSGVLPQTYYTSMLPQASFLVERTSPNTDYPQTLPDPLEGYMQTGAEVLPPSTPVYLKGNYYARRSFELFCFENRSGTVDGLTNVYDRRELAPQQALTIYLLSNVTGNTLVTYILPGKGRETDDGSDGPGAINNFDIDRNSIYHVNVFINGTNDVTIDSRREYLDEPIILELPLESRRIDAHYVDMPAYLFGSGGGIVLQTGTCDVDNNGNIIYTDGSTTWEEGKTPRNLTLMQDAMVDDTKWLRLSVNDPYDPATAQTKLFVNALDGESTHRVIFHFNEYINAVQGASVPAVNPNRRTAIIRVGYVNGARDEDQYNNGVAIGDEQVFYRTVSQYGLKTVGQVGGFNGNYYESLLGVESFEEYQFRYYDTDTPNTGVVWTHTNVSSSDLRNQKYNGKQSTLDRYNAQWNISSSGVPPKRGQSGYDPVFNTNASDYCMRKNRDENGDGIISGAEVKWYLPTPAQQYMMAFWQDAFRFPANQGSAAFATSYWTVFQSDGSNALHIDYNTAVSGVKTFEVSPSAISTRRPVRCVRDITPPAGTQPPVYRTSNGMVVVDLTGYLPESMLADKTDYADGGFLGIGADSGPWGMDKNDKLARRFYFSKSNPVNNPNTTGFPSLPCVNYSESSNSDWIMPTQREMLIVFAHGGLVQAVGNSGSGYTGIYMDAYNWSSTSSNYKIDFASGRNAGSLGNSARYRCVHYRNVPVRP